MVSRVQPHGFTVVEVLLAALILGFVIVGVYFSMESTAHIRGRRREISWASCAAENDIEYVRTVFSTGDTVGDTTYPVSYNGRRFFVQREVMDTTLPEESLVPDTTRLWDYVVTVHLDSMPNPVIRLRFLQGLFEQ